MYTFLITHDNTVVATEKSRIMEKSNLVDKLQFIVEKEYNGFDMSEFDLVIEGFLPITHEIQVETLILADNNYKDLYYAYQLPIDTEITKEPGDLQFTLTFMKSDIDGEGNVVNYVRRISPGVIKVVPVDTWFAAPNTALTELAQMYLANQQNIMALRDVADELYSSAPNGIKLDTSGEEIYLVHGNKRIGTGITLDDLKDSLNNLDDSNTTINI